MGIESQAGHVFEAPRPRLDGRNAIRSAPGKYRDSQMSRFFPFIGRPYAALTPSFGRLADRCPCGQPKHDLNFLDNRKKL